MRIWILVAIAVLLSGCEQKPKDERRFIEYVEIEGTCSEDHLSRPERYKGDIVHWENITKGTASRYGSVFRVEALDTAKIFEELDDPYAYRPPFSIDFRDVPAVELAKQSFQLKGISEHLTGDENDEGPRYHATCDLVVIRRLDHLPRDEERS